MSLSRAGLSSDPASGWGWQSTLDLIPALSMIGLLLMALIPVRLPSAWAAGGLWPLLGLFYWILVQPRLVPVFFVCVMGLLCDLALSMPLGCFGLAFILLHVLLTTQRRFLVGQGFWLVWPAFFLCVMGLYALVFVICKIVQGHDGGALFSSGLPAVFTVTLAFPVLLPVLHLLQRLVNRG